MLEGTKVSLSDIKDELIIQGNDIEKVSQSAASLTDKTRVKNKDVSWVLVEAWVWVRLGLGGRGKGMRMGPGVRGTSAGKI